MPTDDVTISNVVDAAGVVDALGVFRAVWGQDTASDVDVYVAVVHHGGYMSIARRADVAVGAAFGFLSEGGRALHSHVAAVIPGMIGRGVGRKLKHHQRSWAEARGLERVTWTFDPLIRRNAWFNLVHLGARVTRFHQNHYGILADEVNGDDETDRFEVAWAVAGPWPNAPVVPEPHHRLIPTPPDINAVRHDDPAAGRAWRLRMRESVAGPLAGGAAIIGLTVDGSYVLDPTAARSLDRASEPHPTSSPAEGFL